MLSHKIGIKGYSVPRFTIRVLGEKPAQEMNIGANLDFQVSNHAQGIVESIFDSQNEVEPAAIEQLFEKPKLSDNELMLERVRKDVRKMLNEMGPMIF
jgi:hypothetical protein